MVEGMTKENNSPTFEDLNPPKLFREFAAECVELARTTSSPDKQRMYLEMARVWHEMAQRWKKFSPDLL
jgi:acid phosphatase class B